MITLVSAIAIAEMLVGGGALAAHQLVPALRVRSMGSWLLGTGIVVLVLVRAWN